MEMDINNGLYASATTHSKLYGCLKNSKDLLRIDDVFFNMLIFLYVLEIEHLGIEDRKFSSDVSTARIYIRF